MNITSTKNKLLIISLIAVALSGLIMSVYLKVTSAKIRYVSISKLVEEFSMTKEKKKQFETLQSSRKNYLDSLEFKIQQIGRRIENGDKSLLRDFEYEREFYIEKSKAFEEEDARFEQEIQEQVFSRVNQYVEDYGKESGIDLILGANGNGSIMYCAEKHDITKVLVTYINKRYAGKN